MQYYYSLPLFGLVAIGSVLATTPVNGGNYPWVNGIPEANPSQFGTPSNVRIYDSIPPVPSVPVPTPQYAAPSAPARPVVQPSTQGSSPVLSREQYRQVVSGAATVDPGLYRVDWGLQTPVMAMFEDSEQGSTQIGFSVGAVPHRRPQPEPNWYGRVTEAVHRDAVRSVADRDQRWRGYRDTMQQFIPIPQSSPQRTYDPQAPYVPQKERSHNSGCYWDEGVQRCG